MKFLEGMCHVFCFFDCLLTFAFLQLNCSGHGSSMPQYESELIEKGSKDVFERLQVVDIIEEKNMST